MLRMCWISRHDMFEVLNRVSVSLLLSRNASELITRVDLVSVDLQRALESLSRLVQLTAALMDQSEIVMRRCIRGVQRGRLEILLERCLRTMAAHDVAEITTQQHEQKKQ